MKAFLDSEVFLYILKPVIYIGVAYIFYRLLNLILQQILLKNNVSSKHRRKLETSKSIITNFVKYFIIIITILSILSLYHVDVSKIFAGLGIATAVLSLAFQDVAKDFLAGLAILLEDQFEIGDNVSINGFRGDVISMGLKTTRIKDYKGAVKIISNHTINEVINYSLNPSLAVVDISVSYESDLNEVEKVINATMEKINKTYDNLKGKCELWGVEKLDDSAVIYRVVLKTKSNKNFVVERRMKKDFKLALDEAGIKIPYPQLEVHNE
ncbi:mechanosensitive ion channel family protein [bacterium]|nr:mechanosensitive ion channel family protein [bacterium]